MASFGSGVKSVQRGTILFVNSLTAIVTITAVVLAKSVLIFSTNTTNAAAEPDRDRPMGEITDTTTLTFTRTTASGTSTPTVAWQVIEYY